ncbi:MAG TPA: imidazole glycerol phosphate synthase subunit HisH [Terriglobales bacterium]|nr:imidazole glycerol phosphate synthase subunit HisH [Terriglobales bacterium]
MISLIDYGAGNMASVRKAFEHLALETEIIDKPAQISKATKLVLPGVGNFKSLEKLEQTGMRAAIQESVARGVPFLGICLGMQWLFETSTEAPEVQGLGIFPGKCARFTETPRSLHVGWNQISFCNGSSRLFQGIADGSYFYFTHSYWCPIESSSSATTQFQTEFAAALEKKNVFGMQFHPEKSGDSGLRILKNFGELSC